jgi:hypothetical protein
VPAADEAEDVPVVDDREHDAVAEPVDETAGAGEVASATIISSPVTPRLRR